jgi:hypothetical protein
VRRAEAGVLQAKEARGASWTGHSEAYIEAEHRCSTKERRQRRGLGRVLGQLMETRHGTSRIIIDGCGCGGWGDRERDGMIRSW